MSSEDRRVRTNMIYLYIIWSVFVDSRLLGTVSSDSIRCANFININESDLRISSVDNTCTDSLVTALDDEALLICDAASEMARTKVSTSGLKLFVYKCRLYCWNEAYGNNVTTGHLGCFQADWCDLTQSRPYYRDVTVWIWPASTNIQMRIELYIICTLI